MSFSTEIILTATESLELTLNALLQQDKQTLKRLARLEGKVIAFELTDLELCFYLVPHSQGIQIHYLYPEAADTTLKASSLAYLELASGDSARSLFQGEVKISGDIELGQQFQRLFENLQIDWEEWLSQFTGDLVAHNTGTLFKRLGEWHKQALTTLSQDAREYVVDEAEMVPGTTEMEHFSAQINELRNDMARLELRWQRVQQKLNQTA